MKALVNTGPGRLELREVPMPEPKAGQVRIRTAACGICATDLEMIQGWERTGFPAIPGHEWSGVVDALGPGVDPDLLGKRCVAENVLRDGGEVGFEHPGGYGEYLITEAANVYTLPAGIPLAAACLIEPLAVCVRALRRLRLEHRDAALVMGDGPIGLLMLLLLKAENVERVTLVGGRPRRLELAREFGAAATLNYHEAGDDLAGAIAKLQGGAGVDGLVNVIEASGSAQAMGACLDVAARAGKVLVIGDYAGGRADFPWNHLLHRELELIGSNASAGAWARAVELATPSRGGPAAVPLARLISLKMPAARGPEAIDLVRTSRDLVKVILEWNPC